MSSRKKNTSPHTRGNKRVSTHTAQSKETGVYKQGRGNFGFVDTVKEGNKVGYYVHESKKADAMPGDEVFFYTKTFRGKEEAVITGVSQRSENLIVGKLQIQKSFGFVVPESEYIKKDIFIPGKSLKGYSGGERVGVQVINWKGKNPEGRIMEILPKLGQKGADIMRLALEGGARITFPSKTLHEAKSFSQKLSEQQLKGRTDIRNKLTFTIDGADSQDLDDGLSIEKKDNGDYLLSVHIADVAEYVKEDSELDREARKRGTSIYLVNKVIPMLPEELSNGLCSLNPAEPKLTLTCEMLVNNKGHILQTNVYESVIQSDYRLTYKEVQDILDGQEIPILEFGGKTSVELFKSLHVLQELRQALEKYKLSKGVLHFDFPETKIEVDENEFPIRFYQYDRYESHKIIEECMILANEAIAGKFGKYPFLYRVHETPDEEDVEQFAQLLKKFEIDIEVTEVSPKMFQTILNAIEGNKKAGALQRILLRTLMKARYSERNLGHFGLASGAYSHFTSPIRRYPDLQIHRIMKEIIRNNYSPKRKEHYQEILPKVAERSSDREQLSEKIEYKVRDFMAVKFMKDKVGERFTGKISGMIEKGFFIELPNTIEGFVDFGISNMSYEAENFRVWSPISGKEYTFGDEIEVQLMRVDEERLRLDFELV